MASSSSSLEIWGIPVLVESKLAAGRKCSVGCVPIEVPAVAAIKALYTVLEEAV